MANRVLLQPTGMKVSRPGVDVLTAGDADLLFSSDASQTPVHMKGTVTFSSSSIQSVNYGKTFANMPMIMFLVPLGDGYTQSIYINDFIIAASPSNAAAWVRVGSTNFSYYGPSAGGTVFRYIIWDLDL